MILQKTILESNHHDVPFKYIIICSYTSVKLKNIHIVRNAVKKTGLELRFHDKPAVTSSISILNIPEHVVSSSARRYSQPPCVLK